MKRPLFFALLFFYCLSAAGQTDSLGMQDDGLDSLLNLKASEEASELQARINEKITVSSRKGLSQRESPGIVSVITSEEIERSGARDLIDVLKMVPGYDIGLSLDQHYNVGIRGNWNDGGKLAIFLDGIDLNEILFQGFALGWHIPLDRIDHIEIIRGPGSAIYGGTAALGVINIISKKAEQNNYLRVSGTVGQTSEVFSRAGLTLSAAGKSKDFEYTIGAFVGRALRSDQTQVSDWFVSSTDSLGEETYEIYRDTFNLAEPNHSGMFPLMFNAALRYKNTSVQFLSDAYRIETPQYQINYQNYALDISHRLKLAEKSFLTGRLSYYNQNPWNYTISKPNNPFPYSYQVTAKRLKAGLIGNTDFSKNFNLTYGGEFWQDFAEDRSDENRYNGKAEVTYSNFAFFAQTIQRFRLFNLTLGARLDHNNAFGFAFVPRLGLTKRIEDFHFKLLYSRAFRAPGIENIALSENESIKPEYTETAELELGYQFTPEMILTGNVFYANTTDPIIYSYDSDSEDTDGSYRNFGQTGSWGFESEYKIRQKWGFLTLNYSFYKRLESSNVDNYNALQESGAFLQFAQHRLMLNANKTLSKNWNVNLTTAWYGERFGYDRIDDETQEWIPGRQAPYTSLSLFVNWQNSAKNLSLSAGGHDLLNSKPLIYQAYKGDYSPLPSRSREFILKISYTPFSKTVGK